jgi:hypothetical protein
LEGIGSRGLIEVLTRLFPGDTEGIHKKTVSVASAGVLDENRTENQPDMSMNIIAIPKSELPCF